MGCSRCKYYDETKDMVCQNPAMSSETKQKMVSQYGEKCAFFKVEELTDFKPSKEGNFVGNIIEKIAYAIFIVGFIVGILYGQGKYEFAWSVAFIWWISGFISGIGFLGFAEVIQLLDKINHKLGKEV